MKIFVTGGAGFIASHLCARLLELGHEVTAYDNLHLGKEEFLKDCKTSSRFKFLRADLLDFERVEEEIKGAELVYHMAANSDISEGAKKTDVDLKLGTIATYNVLEAMRKRRVPKIIFASTSAIYGEADIKPTPEDYGPLLPISFYGASKLACEALMTAFSHNYDIQVWIYRFANIVGSHSTHGAIHDFVQRLRKDPARLSVLGNGTQKKSYLHVQDCIDGMIYGFENSKKPLQVFNLASRGVTEVKFIAEEVVRQMGLQSQIEFGLEDRGWRGDVPFTWLDGSQFQKLGWLPRNESNRAVSEAIKDILSELR